MLSLSEIKAKMDRKHKIAACLRCSVVFSVRDPFAPRGNRRPHILQCGHSICESCLISSLQVDASVACTKCAQQSLQKQGMKNLNKEFPMNLYVVGQFTERHRSRMPQDNKITFVPPSSPSVSRTVSSVSVKVVGAQQPACSECSEKDAEWSCENCPANYCSPCFKKVHDSARSLKAHVRAPITVHSIPMCDIHSDQRKDFFCHQCNEIICPCCAISSHTGHPVVTRAQMNEEYMDNVLAAVMVATAVLEEITKSQKELQSYLPQEERCSVSGREGSQSSGSGSEGLGPLEKVEQAVASHFAFAHGVLQLQEAKMMERLELAVNETRSGAQAALAELGAASERTRALLAEANRVATAGQLKWCDLRDLTQRLLDTRHEQCRLVSAECQEPQFSFHVDAEFSSQLLNHCRLDVVEGSTVKLEPLGDSPTTSTRQAAVSTQSSNAAIQEESAEVSQNDGASSASHSTSQNGQKTSSTSKPPSPFTTIATPNIVATAAAAALAASLCVTEQTPVVDSSSSPSPKLGHYPDSSKTSRTPLRHSSRGHQMKKGRDSSTPALRNNSFRPSMNRHVSNLTSHSIPSPPLSIVLDPIPVLPFSNDSEEPPPKPFVAVGKPEVVRVVHIKNPSAFYVHRDQDKFVLDNLQKFLDACPERDHLPPNTINIGQMYICKFLVDDRWYRVVVKSCSTMLNPPESRDAIVDVFYVDYGNSERIPLSRLRPLPSRLKDVPPYALHCALFDLHPRKGEEWPEDANRAFCKMVNGARVHMNVMESRDDTYFIDLCAIPGMKHSNFPVSMRDAMVFMDLAQLQDEHSLNIRQASVHFDSEYLKEEPLSKNENFPVVLSHIDSPSQFYAQRRGCHAEYLTKLLDDMSKYYNLHKNGMIYDPGIGMPCAAQFSLDKGWYRAKVLRIPKKSWVEVMYVDYGNREEIPYTSIRKIPEMFMRIPPQAIECSLADVMPSNGNSWLKPATDFFLSITKDKELRLLVNDLSKSYAKVVLYEEKESVDVCLNALLVREGHALSIGVGASIVEYFKVEAAVPEEANQTVIQPSRRKFRKPLKTDPGGVGFLTEEGKNVPGTSGTSGDLASASAGPLLSMPVNIVSVNSPGCLYVCPCSNEEEISDLLADIQEFYHDMQYTETDWKENSKCCAWSEKNKKWYRAVILEILDAEVKVFYKDIALQETIPTTNLRSLDEKFAQVHDGAFKCHMVGIHPAGGQNKWSSVSCEMFTDLVHRVYTELFITKKGDIEDNSLPIELWARTTVSPGPLEPNRVEWISLNQVLVNKGMAIPTTMPETQEIIEHGRNILQNELKTGCTYLDSNSEDYDNKLESISISESSEEENFRHELILYPENPKNRWLDPLPLKKHQFVGMTTYVDSQGLIHLHDVEDVETLALIRDALNKTLKDSQPKPQDMYWFQGQMCLAQFYADKCWYRGKIIKENDNEKYDVLFVDYGNVEVCPIDMLRKDVMMTHIPILCRRFQLHEILPASIDGKWDMDHLDYLHSTLDGKKCSVTVRSSLDDPCPSISLTLPGKIDVAQLLVSLHFAIYSSNLQGNDAASNAASENSVIIENVVETMEMCYNDPEMESEKKTKDVQIPEDVQEVKKDPCVTFSESECDIQMREQTGKCKLLVSCDKELTVKVDENIPCTEETNNETSVETGSGDGKRNISSKQDSNYTADEVSGFGDRSGDKLINSECGTIVEIIPPDVKCEYSAETKNEEDNESHVTASLHTNIIISRRLDSVSVPEACGLQKDNCSGEINGSESNILYEQITKGSKENKKLWSEEVEEVLGESVENPRVEILTYKFLNLEECDDLIVEVTIVMDDPTKIVMVPVADRNDKLGSGIDFNLLTNDMQEEAANRPVILQPYVGQPCCALYSEDMKWYRAIVLFVKDDQVQVEFVDYGNSEWTEKKSIRTIKPVWMAVPVQAIKCSLWNLKIPEDYERRILVRALTKLIFNVTLVAKIKKKSPVAVELYKCGSNTLAYQPLLDTGLLIEDNAKEQG